MSELPNRLAVMLLFIVIVTSLITTFAFFEMQSSMPSSGAKVYRSSQSSARVSIEIPGERELSSKEARVQIKIYEVE